MKAIQRSQLIEQIENDIQHMMTRASQILMDQICDLSDERLQHFVKRFDENHRTKLLNELTNIIT